MKTLIQILTEGKKPILISVDEYKKDKDKYRGAGLYEVGRKQIYHIDVPKGHPHHKRPLVLKDAKST